MTPSDYGKERVICYARKHLFFEGAQQLKKSPKNPGITFSDTLLMSRCQNFEYEQRNKATEEKRVTAKFFGVSTQAT